MLVTERRKENVCVRVKSVCECACLSATPGRACVYTDGEDPECTATWEASPPPQERQGLLLCSLFMHQLPIFVWMKIMGP